MVNTPGYPSCRSTFRCNRLLVGTSVLCFPSMLIDVKMDFLNFSSLIYSCYSHSLSVIKLVRHFSISSSVIFLCFFFFLDIPVILDGTKFVLFWVCFNVYIILYNFVCLYVFYLVNFFFKFLVYVSSFAFSLSLCMFLCCVM